MKLTNEQVDRLQDFCDDYDYELREDYSGRCMFDRRCIGFVVDNSLFEVAMNLCEFLDDDDDDDSEILDVFRNTEVKEDSMGLSRIVYFPCIHATEVEIKE